MKAAVLLLILVVILVVPISGCTQQNNIETQEEAQETFKEVSTDVQELEGIFGDLDQALS